MTQGRVIVDRAWTVLVAKADQDQKEKLQEGSRSLENAEQAPTFIRENHRGTSEKPRQKVLNEEAVPLPVSVEPPPKPPLKSLPEIARERKEILAKAKEREENARKRSPIRPPISSQKNQKFKTSELRPKLEIEEEKKGTARILLRHSQQCTTKAANQKPLPVLLLPQQPFEHLLNEKGPDQMPEEPVDSGRISSSPLPLEEVPEGIIPEQDLQARQDTTILQDVAQDNEDMFQTVQASSISAPETQEFAQVQHPRAITTAVPSMKKKIKKRKTPTNDDRWGLKDYRPKDGLHEHDPEDSNSSEEVKTGGRMGTRSSIPASGTVSATLDFGSTVSRTIGGSTQSTVTAGGEERGTKRGTLDADPPEKKRKLGKGGESGSKEGGDGGASTGLAKVLALFDDSG